MTTERPILFSGPMVRAILDGRKTMTRRIFKRRTGITGPELDPTFRCPYGSPGDRLWVRETWAVPETVTFYRATDYGLLPPGAKWSPSIHMPRRASRLTLEVTDVRIERLHDISEEDARAEGVESIAFDWRNYMPEREAPEQFHKNARESFFSLWESINGTASLASNPWVWVVSFRRLPTT